MAAPGARNDKQLRLLALLKEKDGRSVSIADICDAAGWELSTARKYLNRGIFDDVLVAQADGTYLVRGAARVTETEFLRLASQSKQRQQFGHQFKSPLVRQLLERSRTNVGLAIEVFNRTALENRLDAFVLLFITGWEQLLKAELENREPGSIFTGEKTRTGREKTIGFQVCLERAMSSPADVVRRNLEVIRSLRDDAAHLLVAELQPIAVRYFQSGLVNYCDRFLTFTGEPAIKVVGAGLLSLAMPYTKPDVVALRVRYGNATADEVTALVDHLEREAGQVDDVRFAVDVKYRLVLSDDPAAPAIHLTKASAGSGAEALIVEKAVDAERRYPYFTDELREELKKRTGTTWSRADVQAVIFKEKVKKANNEHHHHFKKTNRHAYSAEFVDLVVRRVNDDAEYLSKARQSYLNSRKPGRS